MESLSGEIIYGMIVFLLNSSFSHIELKVGDDAKSSDECCCYIIEFQPTIFRPSIYVHVKTPTLISAQSLAPQPSVTNHVASSTIFAFRYASRSNFGSLGSDITVDNSLLGFLTAKALWNSIEVVQPG